jgi:hypothetical protein
VRAAHRRASRSRVRSTSSSRHIRLADGQNIRVDEIGRTASASYHVAQVRGAESRTGTSRTT